MFFKADVLNLFDESAIVNPFFVNTGVLTNVSHSATYAAFNPFTDTPVRGVHWDRADLRTGAEPVRVSDSANVQDGGGSAVLVLAGG